MHLVKDEPGKHLSAAAVSHIQVDQSEGPTLQKETLSLHGSAVCVQVEKKEQK